MLYSYETERNTSAEEPVMQNIRQFVSIVVLSLLLSATVASAQVKQSSQGEKRKMSNQTNFQLLIPDTMPKSVGYSQLAVVTGGTVVFIAGQVALDKSGNVVGKDDFKTQIQQVFENLKAAVEAAGGSFQRRCQIEQLLPRPLPCARLQRSP
jgi:enamine deaminase RidA (YjgF/YER057c/UK114 family)